MQRYTHVWLSVSLLDHKYWVGVYFFCVQIALYEKARFPNIYVLAFFPCMAGKRTIQINLGYENEEIALYDKCKHIYEENGLRGFAKTANKCRNKQ